MMQPPIKPGLINNRQAMKPRLRPDIHRQLDILFRRNLVISERIVLKRQKAQITWL
jgi:hypothetical protein